MRATTEATMRSQKKTNRKATTGIAPKQSKRMLLVMETRKEKGLKVPPVVTELVATLMSLERTTEPMLLERLRARLEKALAQVPLDRLEILLATLRATLTVTGMTKGA